MDPSTMSEAERARALAEGRKRFKELRSQRGSSVPPASAPIPATPAQAPAPAPAPTPAPPAPAPAATPMFVAQPIHLVPAATPGPDFVSPVSTHFDPASVRLAALPGLTPHATPFAQPQTPSEVNTPFRVADLSPIQRQSMSMDIGQSDAQAWPDEIRELSAKNFMLSEKVRELMQQMEIMRENELDLAETELAAERQRSQAKLAELTHQHQQALSRISEELQAALREKAAVESELQLVQHHRMGVETQFHGQIQAMQSQLAEAQTALQQQLAAAEARRQADLQAKDREAQAAVEAEKHLAQSLQQRVAVLAQQNEDYAAQIQQLRQPASPDKSVAALQREHQQLQETLAQTRRELNAALERTQTAERGARASTETISHLEHHVRETSKAASAADERAAAALRRAEALSKELEAAQEQNAALNSKISQLEAKLAALEASLASATQQATTSALEVTAKEQELAALTSSLAALKTAPSDDSVQIQALRQQLDAANGDRATLKTRVAELGAELEKRKQAIAQFERDIATVLLQNKNLDHELQESVARFADAVRLSETFSEIVAQKERQMQLLLEENEALVREKAEIQERFAAEEAKTRGRVAEMHGEITQLQSAVQSSIEAIKVEQAQAKSRTEAEHNATLAQLRASHAESLAKRDADHASATERLVETHRSQIQHLEGELTAARRQAQAEIEGLRAQVSQLTAAAAAPQSPAPQFRIQLQQIQQEKEGLEGALAEERTRSETLRAELARVSQVEIQPQGDEAFQRAQARADSAELRVIQLEAELARSENAAWRAHQIESALPQTPVARTLVPLAMTASARSQGTPTSTSRGQMTPQRPRQTPDDFTPPRSAQASQVQQSYTSEARTPMRSVRASKTIAASTQDVHQYVLRLQIILQRIGEQHERVLAMLGDRSAPSAEVEAFATILSQLCNDALRNTAEIQRASELVQEHAKRMEEQGRQQAAIRSTPMKKLFSTSPRAEHAAGPKSVETLLDEGNGLSDVLRTATSLGSLPQAVVDFIAETQRTLGALTAETSQLRTRLEKAVKDKTALETRQGAFEAYVRPIEPYTPVTSIASSTGTSEGVAERIRSMQNELDYFMRKTGEQSAYMASMVEEKAILAERILELEASNDAMLIEREELSTDFDKIRLRLQDLLAHETALSSAMLQHHVELNDLRLENSALQRECAQLRESVSDVTRTQSRLAELSQRAATLEREVETSHTATQTANLRLEKERASVSHLTATVAEQRNTIDRLQAEVAHLSQQTTIQGGQLQHTQAQLRSYEERESETQAHTHSLSHSLAQLKQTHTDVAARLTHTEQLLKQAEGERESGRAQIKQLTQTLHTLEHAAVVSEAARAQMQNELTHTTKLLETTRGQLKDAQDTARDLRERLSDSAAQTAALQARVSGEHDVSAQLKARISDMEQRLEQRTLEYTQVRERCAEISSECSRLSQTLQQTQRLFEEAKSESESVRQQLDRVREQHTHATTEIEKLRDTVAQHNVSAAHSHAQTLHLTAQIQRNESDLAQSERALKETTERLERVVGENQRLSEKHESDTHTIASLHLRLSQLQQSLQQSQDDLRHITVEKETAKSAADKQIYKLQSEVKEKNTLIQSLTRRLQALAQTSETNVVDVVGLVERALSDAHHALEAERAAASTAQHTANEATLLFLSDVLAVFDLAPKDGVRDLGQKMRSAVDALREVQRGWRDQRLALARDTQALTAEKQRALDHAAALQAELQSTREAGKALERQIAASEREVTRLNGELDESRRSLAHHMLELETLRQSEKRYALSRQQWEDDRRVLVRETQHIRDNSLQTVGSHAGTASALTSEREKQIALLQRENESLRRRLEAVSLVSSHSASVVDGGGDAQHARLSARLQEALSEWSRKNAQCEKLKRALGSLAYQKRFLVFLLHKHSVESEIIPIKSARRPRLRTAALAVVATLKIRRLGAIWGAAQTLHSASATLLHDMARLSSTSGVHPIHSFSHTAPLPPRPSGASAAAAASTSFVGTTPQPSRRSPDDQKRISQLENLLLAKDAAILAMTDAATPLTRETFPLTTPTSSGQRLRQPGWASKTSTPEVPRQ